MKNTQQAAKTNGINDALIAANRAKAEVEFEEKGERELNAIRHFRLNLRPKGFRGWKQIHRAYGPAVMAQERSL